MASQEKQMGCHRSDSCSLSGRSSRDSREDNQSKICTMFAGFRNSSQVRYSLLGTLCIPNTFLRSTNQYPPVLLKSFLYIFCRSFCRGRASTGWWEQSVILLSSTPCLIPCPQTPAIVLLCQPQTISFWLLTKSLDRP